MSHSPRLSAEDHRRISAALDRGALTPARAQHWTAYAAAGHDIAFIDALVGGVVLPAAGTVVAAAAPRNSNDYHALFGTGKPEEDGPEYKSLFGPVSEGQRVADVQAAAASDAVSALSEDELHTRMFGPTSSKAAAVPDSERPARDPLAARAGGRAGKHARGEPAGTWNTARRPYPPRPLPIVAGSTPKPLVPAWTRV
jgi:hypothetical protein